MLKVSFYCFAKCDYSMTFLDGFLHSLTVYYSSIYFSGRITIFDDLDGNGNTLASMELQRTPSNPPYDPSSTIDMSFSPLYPISLNFTGVAYSARFEGQDAGMFFDDLSLVLLGGTTSRPTGAPSSAPTIAQAEQSHSKKISTRTPAINSPHSIAPTGYPTAASQSKPPLHQPTPSPNGLSPSSQPSQMTSGQPSYPPTHQPSTVDDQSQPSGFPTSKAPTGCPTAASQSKPPLQQPTPSPNGLSNSSQPSQMTSGPPSYPPTRKPSKVDDQSQPSGLPTFHYVIAKNHSNGNNSFASLGSSQSSSRNIHNSGSTISTGEIAGIAAGGIFVLVSVIIAIFYFSSGSTVAYSGEALRRTSDYSFNAGIQIGQGQPVDWGQGAEGTSDLFVL